MKEWNFKINKGVAVPVFLLGLGVMTCVLPDQDISRTERRRLKAVPSLSAEAVLDGSYMKDMENYLLDQFAGREWFRGLRAEFMDSVMQMGDVEGYFKVDDAVYKLEYELNEKNVRRAALNFAEISEAYFSEADIYYAVIPDKNYFLQEDYGYPVLPYREVDAIMEEYFKGGNVIDLYGTLSLDDYYRTDLHWRQECIIPASRELLMQMGAVGTEPEADYRTEIATAGFYGAYAGASAFYTGPDTLSFLTNDVIEGAMVYDFETNAQTGIYAWDKLGQTDDYDFFLGGARALLTVENGGEVHNGKKLILFRDSFGSSIAPLLLAGYETITLVDLRYVSAEYAWQFIGDTQYDDVLFLYSASMLNHSDSMRF